MQIYWFSGKEISKQILEPAGARGRSPKVSQQQKLQLGACENGISIGNQMVTSEIRK